MKKVHFISPFIIIFFFVASCRQSRVVVRERPVPPHYVQPLAPGPGYIWHGGEWIKYRHTYVYHKGFWMKAPGSHRSYIEGHWVRRRAGWIWIPGHWQ
ncbi:MAG: hypothetical protein ACTHNG_11905 [Ginsengibacter sp.]